MSEVVPEGWERFKLGDISHIYSGGTPSRTNEEFYIGNIPWIKSGEVNKRRIFSSEENISEEALKSSSAKWVKRGSILVAMYGATAGKVSRLMIDATINQAISAVWGDEKTENDFLLHQIEFLSSDLLDAVQGSGQPNLSGQIIKDLNIPLPPLPEQKKIASILTSVDEVIENTQKQIEKLQDLKKATMNELLTKGIGHTEFKDSELGRIPKSWEVRTIKDLVSIKGGKRLPKGESFSDNQTPYPYIRVSDFDNGGINKSKLKYVSESTRNAIKRYTISSRDLYISIAGSIGIVGTIPDELSDSLLTENAAKIVLESESITRDYLKYVINGDLVQAQIKKGIGTGGGVPKLAIFRIEETVICIPKVSEQKQISSMIAALENVICKKNIKLTQTQALKKSLMQDLLTGKKRVQVN